MAGKSSLFQWLFWWFKSCIVFDFSLVYFPWGLPVCRLSFLGISEFHFISLLHLHNRDWIHPLSLEPCSHISREIIFQAQLRWFLLGMKCRWQYPSRVHFHFNFGNFSLQPCRLGTGRLWTKNFCPFEVNKFLWDSISSLSYISIFIYFRKCRKHLNTIIMMTIPSKRIPKMLIWAPSIPSKSLLCPLPKNYQLEILQEIYQKYPIVLNQRKSILTAGKPNLSRNISDWSSSWKIWQSRWMRSFKRRGKKRRKRERRTL